MGYRYLNTTIHLFREVNRKNNTITGFQIPFDMIKPEKVEEQMCIGDFNIVTNINALGSIEDISRYEEEGFEIPKALLNEDKLYVKIRLMKCASNDTEEVKCLDLDDFEIDISELPVQNCAEVPFFSYNRITYVEKIGLMPDDIYGDYVIKVLVKTKEEEKYMIQGMSLLKIADL